MPIIGVTKLSYRVRADNLAGELGRHCPEYLPRHVILPNFFPFLRINIRAVAKSLSGPLAHTYGVCCHRRACGGTLHIGFRIEQTRSGTC